MANEIPDLNLFMVCEKLHSDALSDHPIIDERVNGLWESMDILKKYMPAEAYQQIRIVTYDDQTGRFQVVPAHR